MKPKRNKTTVFRQRGKGKKSDSTAKLFPIVGIGASAGGVEAFIRLIEHLPPDSGMAMVLIPHLAPTHKSELAQVLSRKTRIPIAEAKHLEIVKPNRIYVLPPDKQMIYQAGTLQLSPAEKRIGTPRSIDIFLESLAREHGQRAIGVILSGTATDGTLGLEAIKGEGGFTFAQDSSAKHDSMPRSAIASGCVDLVLPPEAIARELVRIGQHPLLHRSDLLAVEEERASMVEHESDEKPLPSGGRGTPRTGSRLARVEAGEGSEQTGHGEAFKPVLTLLRNHTRVDFSLYKSTTIQRRISRRMILNKCPSLDEYSALLKRSPKELDALYSDVLISVTSFFRNPEVFEFLKRKVFPKLSADQRSDPIRIWVLGCSTGQEAYSLAMAFEEYLDKHNRKPKLQIFASDLNEALLAKARSGLYAKTLAQDISPGRLRRFFTEEDGGYRVCKSLRDLVVFARQNMLHDPPFSRMDLVTCRNVLIYLEGSVHRRIIPTFHYALKPTGFLVLGSSETVGPFTDLFELLDKKHKVFAKKPAPAPALHLEMVSVIKAWSEKKAGSARPAPSAAPLPPQINMQREADRVALNQYVPPSVLVNEALQVLHFRGDTSAYLKPPSGKPTFSLFHIVKEGLLSPLRALMNQALKQKTPVRAETVNWTEKGEPRQTAINILPLMNLKERCYLVFFEDDSDRYVPRKDESEEFRDRSPHSDEESRNRISQLERSLAESRDYLQSVQEQYEAVTEELQASNEEATSANEELQSTNEELETSKEELESTNEELHTVNEEVANRNAELTLANGDLNNLYVNVNMAVVLLSRDLTIRRFTRPAEKVFNLLDSDIGRSLSSIKPNLDFQDLDALLNEVIETVSLREREVRSKQGEWYVLRGRPYFTQDRKVDGAVLMAVDVDQLKKSEQQAKTERDRAEAILHGTPIPLLVLTSDLKVSLANDAFYKTFKTTVAETEGKPIFRLGNGQWDIPQLRIFLEEVIPRNSFIQDFEVTHDFPLIGRRNLFLNARRLDGDAIGKHRILISLHDYTARLEAQQAVRSSEIRFRRLFESARDGIILLDPDTQKVFDANPFALELLGLSVEKLVGKEIGQIGLFHGEQAFRNFFKDLQERGITPPTYAAIPMGKKEMRHIEVISNLYRENGHHVIQCNLRDVTERRKQEQSIVTAKEALEQANRTLEGRVAERTASLESLNHHLTDLSSRLIKAQEDERQRIGRELHDGIGALLIGLKLQLHPIIRPLSSEEQARVELTIAELTKQVRQLSLELHPHVLDDLGLKAALEGHIRAFEQRTKISVRFDSSTVPEGRLSPSLEITIFRIVQEALTNIARHAETKKAEVRFRVDGKKMNFEIRDEGKGFLERLAGRASLGITGMSERVHLMNGTFEIQSKPGKGTVVKVSLPVSPDS